MADQLGENQIDQNKTQWAESSYRFTQPVRYFKNNDPYHWEIDNIPIKQLEENILWLKDQFSTDTQVSGIERKDLAELKPVAVGSGRVVKVQKGRFTARINDAYGKGFQTLIKTANASVEPGEATDRKYKFNLPTDILKQIAGDVVGEALYFNGLYEHLQHHQVTPNNSNLSWTATTLNTINAIPKNKLSVWRQGETMTNDIESLGELAVSFTRRWGGAIRTAVVNVKDDIEIVIPPFSDADYNNKTGFNPAVRADLLFIYSHPIDAESTTIALPDGDSPTVITEPRLGLLKGAGVISLKGYGQFDGYESTNGDSGFFDNTFYQSQLTSDQSFFRSIEALSDENHYQTLAPLADFVASDSDLANTSVSFPSPDDVMNLTPLFQEGLQNSFALIGQSVLPIAYVITQKGKAEIGTEDIIDIRPFFRTAELSYNERSGVAAANPPLSFANPAVGKTELNTAVTKAVTKLKTYVDSALGGIGGGTDDGTTPASPTRFITKGTILGGTKFGVEGAMLTMIGDMGGAEVRGEDDIISFLQQKQGLVGLGSLPLYPGWDLGAWTSELEDPVGIGELRNDRINCAIKLGNQEFQNFTGDDITKGIIEEYVERIANNKHSYLAGNYGYNQLDVDVIYYLRKRLKVELPQDIQDYDVQATFINCVPSQGAGGFDNTWNSNTNTNNLLVRSGRNSYTGITIHKNSINGNVAEFTIYVAFVPPSSTDFLYPGTTGASYGYLRYKHEDLTSDLNYNNESFFAPPNPKFTIEQRKRDIFSGFSVINQAYDPDKMVNISTGGNIYSNNNINVPISGQIGRFQPAWKALKPLLVTYPTVEFTVTGYTQAMPSNYIYNTETTGGQPIIT